MKTLLITIMLLLVLFFFVMLMITPIGAINPAAHNYDHTLRVLFYSSVYGLTLAFALGLWALTIAENEIDHHLKRRL